jgi:hypothetical protein
VVFEKTFCFVFSLLHLSAFYSVIYYDVVVMPCHDGVS